MEFIKIYIAPYGTLIVSCIFVLQVFIFIFGWYSRSQIRKEELRLREAGVLCRKFTRWTSPAGETLVTLGILGTFIGLTAAMTNAEQLSGLMIDSTHATISNNDLKKCSEAYDGSNEPSRQNSTENDSGAIAEMSNAEKRERTVECFKSYFKVAANDACFAFLSSIAGIIAALLAKGFWPTPFIYQSSVDELRKDISDYSEQLAAGQGWKQDEDNFLFKKTFSRLINALAERPSIGEATVRDEFSKISDALKKCLPSRIDYDELVKKTTFTGDSLAKLTKEEKDRLPDFVEEYEILAKRAKYDLSR